MKPMMEQPGRSFLMDAEPEPTAPAARPPRLRALGAHARPRSLPFDQHPTFRELHAARQLGMQAGLRDPHYRTHEARAGAHTRLDGRELINFASYDYLGLNGHPEVLTAHADAAALYGTSVSGSRLTSGERPIHAALEAALADLYEAEAGLLFVSGHATPGSVLHALLGPRDLILHDELIHNCVVVGAEGVRCQRKSYRHNDMEDLERYMVRHRDQFENVLIITEGLFSMDGDGCDLRALIDIKERHGAWLMVDEAHALGVMGATGKGSAEHAGVDPRRIDIWFGTLSKALVSCGGYICGSRALTDILRARAPGLVYSVGMPAPVAAAALSALGIMRREPQRVHALQARSHDLWEGMRALGLDLGTSWGVGIVPVILGGDLATLAASQRLEALGINTFPVLQPGVPANSARLRFFVSAAHASADIERALEVLRVAAPLS
nr:aminotransferase class I/II-fold pyridoxal phosphate-dependent enzyme [uncultured Roseococcus sp.]